MSCKSAEMGSCQCRQQQTMNNRFNMCPLTKSEGRLQSFHNAEERCCIQLAENYSDNSTRKMSQTIWPICTSACITHWLQAGLFATFCISRFFWPLLNLVLLHQALQHSSELHIICDTLNIFNVNSRHTFLRQPLPPIYCISAPTVLLDMARYKFYLLIYLRTNKMTELTVTVSVSETSL